MSPLTEDVVFTDVLNFLFTLVIIVTAILSVVYIIRAGFLFITSGGDTEKSNQALLMIRNSIVGLVIVITSVAVVNLVGRVLDIRFLPEISIDRFRDISESIFDRLSRHNDEERLRGILDE